MSSKHCKSLPVIMHHCVNRFPDKLCMSPERFEQQCALLAENGWHGVGLGEAEDFFVSGAPLPPKSLLITFDDGYLDNYVYAWPILEKYGHKGVIFPVADCIDTASASLSPRPTVKDLEAGRITQGSLRFLDDPIKVNADGQKVRKHDFFNWQEASQMASSNTIGFGAHTLRHAGIFSGPEYDGFYRPGDQLVPFNKEVGEIPYGMPLFRKDAELATRAYKPAPELVEAIKALVPQTPFAANDFFSSDKNISQLEKLVSKFGNQGSFETEQEYQLRVRGILSENIRIFQKKLGFAPRSLCWPWGLKSAEALSIAQELGFEVFFNVSPGVNPPRQPMNINRINAKQNPQKTFSRIRIYSKPILGRLYTKFRI